MKLLLFNISNCNYSTVAILAQGIHWCKLWLLFLKSNEFRMDPVKYN